MNRIVIGSYEFTDDTISENPQKYISNSMLADSLEIDTLEFSVYSYGIGTIYIITSDGYTFATSSDEPYVVDEGYFQNLPYGTPVYLYKDNTLRGKFYTKSILRTGITQFSVSCVSAIGLLDGARTLGGIYEGETAGSIISALMADASFTDFTVDSEIANLAVYGWIPAGSVRDALNQILFAFGASILKQENGSIRIYYIGATTPKVISDAMNYIGGSVDNPQTVTDVNLYEHSFVVSTDNVEEVLFDNSLTTSANGLTMIFSEPFHSLRTTGTLVIDDSGANYAVVTGLGQLIGKKYTHTRRLLSQSTELDGERNEVTISDATLVSTANSSNCLKRLVNYYKNAIPMNVSLVDNSGLKPGDYIQLTDPFGDTVQGFIQAIDETVSDIDKAESTIIKNYVPTNLGNSYDRYRIVYDTEVVDGYWNFPAELANKAVLIVLFSGAQGGQGGYAGRTPGAKYGTDQDPPNNRPTNPHYGRNDPNNENTAWLLRYSSGSRYEEWRIGGGTIQRGGAGGQGGAGGSSATRILNFNYHFPSNPHPIPVSFGQGGLGGQGGSISWGSRATVVETLPSLGEEGEDSVFDGHSTADGTLFHGIYINIITGTALAESGATGGRGGNGGDGGASRRITYVSANNTDSAYVNYSYKTLGKGQNGESIGSNTGGIGADGENGTIQRYNADLYYLPLPGTTGFYARQDAGGGGGGGAAMGANGGNGQTGSKHSANINEYVGGTLEGVLNYYYVSRSTDDETPDHEVLDQTWSGALGGDGANAVTIPPQPRFVGGTGGYGGGGGGGAGMPLGNKYYYSGTTGYNAGRTRSGKGGDGGQGGQGSNGFAIIYYNSED